MGEEGVIVFPGWDQKDVSEDAEPQAENHEDGESVSLVIAECLVVEQRGKRCGRDLIDGRTLSQAP